MELCKCIEPTTVNGGTPKYSVSLIIPKSDTVTIEKSKHNWLLTESEAKLR